MANNGWTINDVATTFAQQEEYTNLYSGLSYSQIVTKVYTNVLNRTADSAGADYWEGELQSGNISVSQLVLAVVTAATETNENGSYKNPDDANLFNNKIEVSQYAYNINSDATDIPLASVTASDNTVNSLEDIITNNTAEIDVVDDGTYNGNYLGDESGQLTFTVSNTDVTGQWYSPSWNEVGYVYGSVNNETESVNLSSNDEDGVPITFTGTLMNGEADGTWSMPYYGQGTFHGELA